MMRFVLCVLSVFAFVAPVGARDFVKKSATQSVSLPEPDKAQLIFLRPSSLFGGMYTMLSEVTPDGDRFISAIGGKDKVVYSTAPGRKMFVSNDGMRVHFMDADLEAGRRYYVLVRPVYGNGYQLRPVRRDGGSDYSMDNPDFINWVRQSRRVEALGSEPPMPARALPQLAKARELGWASWLAKTPGEHAELTLERADAVDR